MKSDNLVVLRDLPSAWGCWSRWCSDLVLSPAAGWSCAASGPPAGSHWSRVPRFSCPARGASQGSAVSQSTVQLWSCSIDWNHTHKYSNMSKCMLILGLNACIVFSGYLIQDVSLSDQLIYGFLVCFNLLLGRFKICRGRTMRTACIDSQSQLCLIFLYWLGLFHECTTFLKWFSRPEVFSKVWLKYYTAEK